MTGDNDDKMDQDPIPPPKKADPNDLSVYNLDEYDKEEAGVYVTPKVKVDETEFIRYRNGLIQQHQGLNIL